MDNILIALLAYSIDRIFGEFRFIRHPVCFMGDIIKFFENRFYKESIARGFLLVIFTISIAWIFSYTIQYYINSLPWLLNIILSSLVASMFIAHKMLRDSVKEILHTKNKKEKISYLVSRDTQDMDESQIYKASIETYAENLSDGVVAPVFYLLLFGLKGIIIYKAINTLDSMVGYKNKRYEKFGKVAARLDDVANFIPSRITAVLIMLFSNQKDIFAFYKDGKKHSSPNAGHPITAMALACGVKLGGETSYFGKKIQKPYFGHKKETIESDDLKKALSVF